MKVGRIAGSGERVAWPLVGTLFLAVVAVWTVPFLSVIPYDYGAYLLPWWQHILERGRIQVFAEPFSNYTPPYLYLLSAATLFDRILAPLYAIKLLSALGAAWLGYAVFRLFETTGTPRPIESALGSLLLPTMLINVPILAQADAFWVAPSILAVTAGVRRDALKMVLWASVAFAFKAQAVFIAPFVMATLLSRRAPWWYWLLPPIVYSLAMLPAWLVGWPASELALVYVKQAAWVGDNGFASDAANPWMLFRLIDNDLVGRSFWIGYIAAGVSTCLFVWTLRRARLDPPLTVAAASTSSAMLPFVLPGMHERFFALAEILAFALVFIACDWEAFYAAVLLQLALVAAFAGWKVQNPWISVGGLFFSSGAIVLLVARLMPVIRLYFRSPMKTPESRTSGLASD